MWNTNTYLRNVAYNYDFQDMLVYFVSIQCLYLINGWPFVFQKVGFLVLTTLLAVIAAPVMVFIFVRTTYNAAMVSDVLWRVR